MVSKIVYNTNDVDSYDIQYHFHHWCWIIWSLNLFPRFNGAFSLVWYAQSPLSNPHYSPTLESFPSCCRWHRSIPDVGFQVIFCYPFIQLGFTGPLCLYYHNHPYYKGKTKVTWNPTEAKYWWTTGLAGVWHWLFAPSCWWNLSKVQYATLEQSDISSPSRHIMPCSNGSLR